MTEQDYKNAALEYVRDFFEESDLSAMSPRYDESATEGQDIFVEVKAGNWNYHVTLNSDGEVLDCQRK